jgi:inosine-uridine nucleoside N-ribohydrolase
MKPLIGLLLAAALLATACGTSQPSTTPATAGPVTSASPEAPAVTAPSSAGPSPATGAGTRPIVIDTDLAADDLLAIMVLLRDPTVDVRAITVAGTGEVRCPAGLRNVRRLLAAFGRSEVPVACGRENPGLNGRWFPAAWRDGADAFYGVELPAVEGEGARGVPAAELLVDLAADAATSGAPLTLVPLGPWTNLADAAALDPAFAGSLAGIHAMGGAIDVPGNIETGDTAPADGVEWNLGVDPDAVAAVLALDVPVTFVPLDATNDVPVPADIADQLAPDHAATGADIAYEMYARNPFLATPGNDYWDTLTAALLRDPAIATWEDVTVRAETSGASAGRLVRDPGGRTVRAAMGADRDAFMRAFLAALRTGAPRPQPFELAGNLAVEFDGTTCRILGEPPSSAGLATVELRNLGPVPVYLLVGGAVPPKTWADTVAWLEAADLSDPNLAIPAWAIEVEGGSMANAGQTTTTMVTLPEGNLGVACGTGEWPDFTFFDAGPFTLGG